MHKMSKRKKITIPIKASKRKKITCLTFYLFYAFCAFYVFYAFYSLYSFCTFYSFCACEITVITSFTMLLFDHGSRFIILFELPYNVTGTSSSSFFVHCEIWETNQSIPLSGCPEFSNICFSTCRSQSNEYWICSSLTAAFCISLIFVKSYL